MTMRRFRRTVVAGALAVAVGATGWAAPASAVVGGAPTEVGFYPYFVKLSVVYLRGGAVYGTGLCGGSVIGAGWILTAAHCFEQKDGVPFSGIGAHVSTGLELTGMLAAVHPRFNGHTTDGHDLALVRVAESYTYSIPWIQVGAPGDPDAYVPGTLATIMGHGRTSAGGKDSVQLRAVNSVLRSDDYMDDLYNKWYWFDYWPDPLVIGAGASRRTACNGDSGGPLVVYRDGVHVQVGVASFTKESCNAPAGFAELSGSQLAWIATQVPSISQRWGFCDAGLGTIGRYTANYSTMPFAGAERDGSYYWGFGCEPFEPLPTVRAG